MQTAKRFLSETRAMTTAEAIVERMPDWFAKLAGGEQVFGRRKDQLILEIFDLGGLELLQSMCDIPFEKSKALPRKVRLNVLIRIKRMLVQRQKVAQKHLSIALTNQLNVKQLKAGVFSVVFPSNQKR